MPFIQPTADDLKRGVLIDPPGWYTVKVNSISDWETAKSGNSQNCRVDADIIRNADSGDEKFAGFKAPNWMFNDKFMSGPVGFMRALGHELKADERFDLNVGVGQVLDVFIVHDVYQGNTNAKVEHRYRPTR